MGRPGVARLNIIVMYLGPVLRRLSISKQKLVIRISDHRFALTTALHLRPKPRISDPELVHEFVFYVSDHSPASQTMGLRLFLKS